MGQTISCIDSDERTRRRVLSKEDSDRELQSLVSALERMSAAKRMVYSVTAPGKRSTSLSEKAYIRKPLESPSRSVALLNRKLSTSGRRLALSGRPQLHNESLGNRSRSLSESSVVKRPSESSSYSRPSLSHEASTSGRRLASSGRPQLRRDSSGQKLKAASLGDNKNGIIKRIHRSEDPSSTRSLQSHGSARSLQTNTKKACSMRELRLGYDDENAAMPTLESSNDDTTTTTRIRSSSLRPSPPCRVASLRTLERTSVSFRCMLEQERQSSLPKSPVNEFSSDRSSLTRSPVRQSHPLRSIDLFTGIS
jgi:hypothetical protein